MTGDVIRTSSRSWQACAGQTNPTQDLPVSSVTALTRFVGYLQVKGKPFWIREDVDTFFPDLRDGAVVLIGAFINQWTLRLTGHLPYTFREDPERKLRLIFDFQSQPPPVNGQQ